MKFYHPKNTVDTGLLFKLLWSRQTCCNRATATLS